MNLMKLLRTVLKNKETKREKCFEEVSLNLDEVQSNGQTLLTQAILDKNAEEWNKWLVAGASPDAKNECGETPLIVAIRYLEPKISERAVVELLRAGASERLSDNKKSRPIHYAVQKDGMEDVIVALYNKSGPCCACWKNKEEKTAADLAVSKGVREFFQKMFVRQMRAYELDDAHLNDFKKQVRQLIAHGSVAPLSDAPTEAEPRRISTQDLKTKMVDVSRQYGA